MKRSIARLRLEYGNTPLLEEDLKDHPIDQFIYWLDNAIESQVMEPNAMTLATISSAHRPASRIVLLKKVNKEGFCFFTHYTSRKGEHLNLNPYASLTFWWKEIYRQVNIEGFIKKMPRNESASYFDIRPKGAQLAALSSKQSSPIASRLELEEAYERIKKKYRGKKVLCPKSWGGYCIEPERIEFWQGRKNRLHDRFLYVKMENNWIRTRLSP